MSVTEGRQWIGGKGNIAFADCSAKLRKEVDATTGTEGQLTWLVRQGTLGFVMLLKGMAVKRKMYLVSPLHQPLRTALPSHYKESNFSQKHASFDCCLFQEHLD